MEEGKNRKREKHVAKCENVLNLWSKMTVIGERNRSGLRVLYSNRQCQKTVMQYLKDLQSGKNVTQGFYIQPNYLSTIKFKGSFEHERILGISTLEV